MDCNNYWKCMFDAITETGLVWIDDNVTCERVNRIYYDSDNPRIELTIRPVDYVGVFDNASQMEQFESVCVGCRKYKRNCSLLKKAKEGRVQKEIAEGVCSKYVAETKEDTNNGNNDKEDDSNGKEGSRKEDGKAEA